MNLNLVLFAEMQLLPNSYKKELRKLWLGEIAMINVPTT
jgi:hypothetical protein